MSVTVFSEHDVVLLDLDGTVYHGGVLVPGAEKVVHEARDQGVAVRYVTNNASKSDEAVARQLTALGLAVERREISTSSQAAAAMLAAQLPTQSRVLVLGSSALESEVAKVGLVPGRQYADGPVAVVQGLSTEITWSDLAEACLSLRDGALWIASNADATLPTDRGELPGNGALVAALSAAVGGNPQVAGKPERPLLDDAVNSAGGENPLIVGDRLDTDIAGAVGAGMSSMLVLTGVTRPCDVLRAGPACRPTYLAADLTGLQQSPDSVRVVEQPAWHCQLDSGVLQLACRGNSGTDSSLSALRALCSTWWAAGAGPVEVRALDTPARSALNGLELA